MRQTSEQTLIHSSWCGEAGEEPQEVTILARQAVIKLLDYLLCSRSMRFTCVLETYISNMLFGLLKEEGDEVLANLALRLLVDLMALNTAQYVEQPSKILCNTRRTW